ncbi:zinc finger protein 135 [Culex quinquefasciatus]|uniref:zinc finger protein 135 n=1 Tax=Culex quinquefasciatus TaxID=7176 RepID=UPI0018E2C6A3|nr:zinc finger protein 135 [Culex quinquefasciatus]
MPTFRLKTYPNVCRMCLQAKPSAEMVSLDSYRPQFSRSVAEMLEEVASVKIPMHLTCYLPTELCEQCLDVFEFFYKYKRKLDLVQRFCEALAEVKCGNQLPLEVLFETEKSALQMLFKDLDLCDREDFRAVDLLEEFCEYDIASTICVKVESASEMEDESNDYIEEDDGGSGESVGDYDAELAELGLKLYKEDDELEEEPGPGRDEVTDNYMQEFQKSLEEELEIEPDGDVVPAGLQVEPVSKVIEPIAQVEEAQSEVTTSEVTMLENFAEDEDDEDYMEESDVDIGDGPLECPPKKRKYNRFPEEEADLQECALPGCKFITSYPSQFEKHLARHHPDQQDALFCHRSSCADERFDTPDLLRQHKNDVHSTHICGECGKVAKHLIALENHQKQSHGRGREPTIPCTVCESKFRNETELQRHIEKDHGMRFGYECPECGLGFKMKLLLTQHLLTHSVVRNYNCDQCGNAFKTSNHLRRHIKTVHAEVRYPCELCPVSYGRKDKLRMHMERVHEIQTYFVCDICCCSFESSAKLAEHRDRHDKPDDLECGLCLTACPSVAEFNEHLCISYQDDYVCCRRDFRYHSFYNRHMFLAHGVKTNARVKPKAGVLMGKQRAMRKPVERCTLCEHVFPTRKTKKAHMETCAGQVVIFEIEPVADGIASSIADGVPSLQIQEVKSEL